MISADSIFQNLESFAGGSLCALGEVSACEDYVQPYWYALVAIGALGVILSAIFFFRKLKRRLWLTVGIIGVCIVIVGGIGIASTLILGGAAKEARYEEYEQCVAEFKPGGIACEY